MIEAHDRLGHAGSELVLASLEDAMLVTRRPNLPGTTTEHPNWSMALPEPIDAPVDAAVDDVGRVLRHARPK